MRRHAAADENSEEEEEEEESDPVDRETIEEQAGIINEYGKTAPIASFRVPSITLGEFPGLQLPRLGSVRSIRLPSFRLGSFPNLNLDGMGVPDFPHIELPSIDLKDFPGIQLQDLSLNLNMELDLPNLYLLYSYYQAHKLNSPHLLPQSKFAIPHSLHPISWSFCVVYVIYVVLQQMYGSCMYRNV